MLAWSCCVSESFNNNNFIKNNVYDKATSCKWLSIIITKNNLDKTNPRVIT